MRVFAVGLALTGAAYSPASTGGLVVRLVDYDCQPLAGRELLLSQGKRPSVPYGGGSNAFETRTTDVQGVAQFDMLKHPSHVRLYAYEANKALHEMALLREVQQSQRGIEYIDGKPVSYDDLHELRESNRGFPLHLYAGAGSDGLQVWETHSFGFLRFKDEINRIRIGRSHSSRDSAAVIHARWRDGKALLQLFGVGTGGAVEIEGELPADLVTLEGHSKSLEYAMEHGPFRRVIHVIGPQRRWSTLLVLELDYDARQRSALFNLYAHTVAPERPRGRDKRLAELHHYPERCGGANARGVQGEYATLTAEKRRFASASAGYLRRTVPPVTADLLPAMREPTTQIEWIREQVVDAPDPQLSFQARIELLIASLDNNADLPERFELAYEFAVAHRTIQLFDRLARDPRTPPRILAALFEREPDRFAGMLARNTGSDDVLINRLLDHYAAKPQELNPPLAFLAGLPNASEATLHRILDTYAARTALPPNPARYPADGVLYQLLTRKGLPLDLTLEAARFAVAHGKLDNLGTALRKLAAEDAAFRRAWLDDLLAAPPALGEGNNAVFERRRLASLWAYQQRYVGLDGDEAAAVARLLEQLGVQTTAMSVASPPEARQQRALARYLNGAVIEPGSTYFDPGWDNDASVVLAKNLATPSEVLRGLFIRAEDGQVISLLAGHPSTPPDVLERILAKEYVIATDMPNEYVVWRRLYCHPAFDQALRANLPFMLDTDCARELNDYF